MLNESNTEGSLQSFLYFFQFALRDHLSLIVTILSYVKAAQDRF